jgi:hypothetical protein
LGTQGVKGKFLGNSLQSKKKQLPLAKTLPRKSRVIHLVT